MTTPHDADDRLKDAFRTVSADSRVDASDEDVERVWRAVSGELPAGERRDVVDRIASEPAVAEAWRVAHELRRAQVGDAPADVGSPARSWTPAWIGLAALLVLSVGVSLLQFRREPADAFRDRAATSSSRSWRRMPRFRVTHSSCAGSRVRTAPDTRFA